jgi:excisionase family DNA binding protein
MKTYSNHEAAELTGLSVRALRKRIERGQLRAVQQGRYWRIPHVELERAGLMAPLGTIEGQGTEGTGPGPEFVLAELERERVERLRLTQEVARLRPLTVQIERVTDDLHRERAERKAAEARATEAISRAEELRERERELATAGFFARRRLLRELRYQPA